MARGQLRVYLGAAPGVGKTYRMLDEGRRRRDRGTDVVIGLVETHQRRHTESQVGDLEIVGRVTRTYRGTQFEEMDLDAVLARHPEVVLVDELAHTNVPGGDHEKRWQDVEALLEAGITVITTVNIQHLESVNDVVEKITGVTQQETIPDGVVRRAEQIELVDITPEALRRRMAHGNIYAAEKVDASLSNYFRAGNLTALRELALLWLADRVEDALQSYLDAHDISATWETRERLIVAVSGSRSDEVVVRRAARIASRTGAEVIAVHVVNADGPRHESDDVGPVRELVAELDGRFHELVDDDVAGALVAFARSERGTQLVLGASRARSPFAASRGVVTRALRQAQDLDVHVIALDAQRATRPRPRGGTWRGSWRGNLAGLALTGVVMGLVTVAMTFLRRDVSLSTTSLVYLVSVVALTAWGGAFVGVVAAFVGSGLENFYFVAPLHTLEVARPDDVVSLVVFLLFAVAASVLVSQFAKRSRQAERARAEADLLVRTAATLATGHDDLRPLLDSLRSIFDLSGVSLMVRRDGEWESELVSGTPVDAAATNARFVIGDDHVLVLAGVTLNAHDHQLVRAFADRVAAGLRSVAIQHDAAELDARARADGLRSELLRALSHDLRSPLEHIESSVEALLADQASVGALAPRPLLEDIGYEVQRLTRLMANLVDAGRLEAQEVKPAMAPVSVAVLIADVLASIDTRDRLVDVEVAPDLPRVWTDPQLVERIIANVVGNACRFSPEDRPVRISAGVSNQSLEVLVVDQGPGLTPAHREAMSQPFQHLHVERPGVGLGLTVASGFARLLDGELRFEDTPSGGLTVVIELPLSNASPESA